MELIKIDPNNPPQFNTQILFYDSALKLFRLGEVDYIREDRTVKRIIYKPFDLVPRRNNNDIIVKIPFKPTHYLNIDLDEFAKTVKDKIKLVKVDIYRDGGTTKWVSQDDYEKLKKPKETGNVTHYYLDNKIASDTNGCLLDAYPGSNANVLDITLFDFT